MFKKLGCSSSRFHDKYQPLTGTSPKCPCENIAKLGVKQSVDLIHLVLAHP